MEYADHRPLIIKFDILWRSGNCIEDPIPMDKTVRDPDGTIRVEHFKFEQSRLTIHEFIFRFSTFAKISSFKIYILSEIYLNKSSNGTQ